MTLSPSTFTLLLRFAVSPSTPPPSSSAFAETSRHRVLVLALTLNEADNLPHLLDGITTSLPDADILVIDDNSPDGTGMRAQEIARDNAKLSVLIRRDKRGLGSALRDGIGYAIEHEYDFLLNLDADLSHDPADLPRLLQAAAAETPPIDVVVGSRYVERGGIEGWPLRRRAMSRMVNRFATMVLRLPVRDCSGALRCYRVEHLKKLDLPSLRSNGYAMLEELLLRLRATGATMREVPIIFTDRQRGHSKLTSREAFRSAWQLIRMAIRSS